MLLHYKQITIRNAAEADAPFLAGWWNDGSVMAHAGFPNGLGTTPEKVAADMAKDTDDTRRRLILLWNSIPIGEMVYRNIGSHTADIGIKSPCDTIAPQTMKAVRAWGFICISIGCPVRGEMLAFV